MTKEDFYNLLPGDCVYLQGAPIKYLGWHYNKGNILGIRKGSTEKEFSISIQWHPNKMPGGDTDCLWGRVFDGVTLDNLETNGLENYLLAKSEKEQLIIELKLS